MADIKITDLTAYTDPVSTDVLPIVDVGSDITKKVSIADLLENAGTGSAAAPSFSFDGDNDTGIYRPGADQLAISTNGTGRLFVDASGNVKVGSPNTSAVFNVQGSGGLGIDIAGRSSDGGSQLRLMNNAGSASNAALFGGDTYAGVLSATYLAFQTGGSERLRIDSSGNVGIGTSSPGRRLSVQNSAVGTEGIALYRNTGDGTLMVGLSQDADGHGEIRVNNTSGTRNAQIRGNGTSYFNGGNVGIGTTSPSSPLEVASSGSEVVRFRGNGASGGWASWNSGGTNYGYIGPASLLASGTSTQFTIRSDNELLFTAGGGTERARIDNTGRLLVGTSASVGDDNNLQIVGSTADASAATFWRSSADQGNPSINFVKTRGSVASPSIVSSGDILGHIRFSGHDGTDHNSRAAEIKAEVDGTPGANDMPGRLTFSTTADGASTPTERMRIDRNGLVDIGGYGNAGLSVTTPVGTPLQLNRTVNDGELVRFKQDGTTEGSITVSGTTVSYNGAHLSRWSQLPGGATREEILRGTVLSNIDEMCDWGEEDNEQLNRMKVSDVEGDRNVSGVFQAWDDDDDTYTNDFYCAMTGDFVIRIAQGVTVERGDLLMSAGDGTAKPQDDDIIRSKTIAKVTSTNVSETYADGSYCVPCVLMAC